MDKYVFIGPPGSGKSTLTTDVFTRLKKQGVNAELLMEWIRGDINKHGPMESVWEQYRVVNNQREMEDTLPNNLDVAICDAGTLTSFFYASLYCDDTEPRQRVVLSDMYKYWLDDVYLRRYTQIFYVPTKQTYAVNPNILGDGTRYQSMSEVDILESHMELMFCKLHNGVGNITALHCPLEERTDKVLEIIDATRSSKTR